MRSCKYIIRDTFTKVARYLVRSSNLSLNKIQIISKDHNYIQIFNHLKIIRNYLINTMFLNPTRTLNRTTYKVAGSLDRPRANRGLINELILLYNNISAM